MKNLYFFILLLTYGNVSYSQNKKPTSIQPYSISNIKLGMSVNEFLSEYKDSITVTSVQNSTTHFKYDNLIINEIEVYEVLVSFYKNKLMTLYFKTVNPKMHWGLSAKYGYVSDKEYQQFYEDQDVTIGGYGKYNDHYGLTHIKFSDSEGFIMKDRKTEKLSLAEGF